MARIKGKWVGQVVINCDWGEEYIEDFSALEKEMKTIRARIEKVLTEAAQSGVTVTVTQLHADLYRDEPSEWTKEEAN